MDEHVRMLAKSDEDEKNREKSTNQSFPSLGSSKRSTASVSSARTMGGVEGGGGGGGVAIDRSLTTSDGLERSLLSRSSVVGVVVVGHVVARVLAGVLTRRAECVATDATLLRPVVLHDRTALPSPGHVITLPMASGASRVVSDGVARPLGPVVGHAESVPLSREFGRSQ